jgi:regulator of protease activity HflC (stomatin/prohibitin superfamily)
MNRRLTSFLVVLALVVIVFLAFAVKRVPVGHEAVRISRDGEVELLGPGLHVVRPGYLDYVIYPTGGRSYRSPSEGTHRVVTQGGEALAVAFSVAVTVPPASAPELYQRFSEDFGDAVDRVVRAAAETEAVTTSVSDDRDRYLDGVTARVREQLAEVGVVVSSMTLESWDRLEPPQRVR